VTGTGFYSQYLAQGPIHLHRVPVTIGTRMSGINVLVNPPPPPARPHRRPTCLWVSTDHVDWTHGGSTGCAALWHALVVNARVAGGAAGIVAEGGSSITAHCTALARLALRTHGCTAHDLARGQAGVALTLVGT
jgi:hypothetical protein